MALPVRQQVTYWGVAAAGLGLTLWGLGDVILPFLVGGAIAYFMDPVADRLQRLGLSRVAATTTIALLAMLMSAFSYYTRRDYLKAVETAQRFLTIHPGKTILNGKVLDEPYTAEDPDYDLPRTKIADGELLVLGDNRNNSNDGHRWGPLERRRLLGKAMFIFWPLNRVRIVH